MEIHESLWRVLCLFDENATQWRVGFNGAYGLDYQAVRASMDDHEIPACDRMEVMAQLRIMESEALKIMKENEHG